MKIEAKDGQIILKQVYNSITLETNEGKQLHICMRDFGFEVKIDDGQWHLIQSERDVICSKEFVDKLFDEIKHGDEEHQEWLRIKMNEYYDKHSN